MPGLLDFLQSEDAQLGLGLLGAAGPRSDGAGFGQRLQEAMAYGQAQKDAKMKREFMGSQMDNYRSEIEARKLATVQDQRKQAMIESMFGGPGGGRPDAGQMPASGAQGESGASGGGLVDMAKRLGIPEQAIQADMVFNGGKGISAMLEKRGAPDMQVSNGYAYDKNKMAAGFMPSLSTSTNGQTSMTQIGPDGLPVVSAPRGALETAGAYAGMQAGLSAAGRVNLRENADGTKSPVSEFSENPVLQGMIGARPARPGYATEPQMKATVGGGMGADPAALQREIKTTQRELMNPMDANSRKMIQDYLAGLQRQAGDPRMGSATGAPAYGMTNDQAAQAEAGKARLVGTANADVVRATGQQKEGKLYGQLTAGLDRAIGLLGQGPTASGAGSMVDGAAGFFGKSTKGADVASQLETVSGWLTSNVPRMEGPQSDKDVQQYRIMAAEVGDRTKPVSQRLAAAKELQGLQAKYAELNGGQANTGGASGSFADKPAPAKAPPPQAMKGMVRGGYKFKGGDPSDQSNWEKQ